MITRSSRATAWGARRPDQQPLNRPQSSRGRYSSACSKYQFHVTIRRPEALVFRFVAPDFTDAEVRPPKFLHGIEPSQVCRWRPPKRSSRAGGPRCEPSPQTTLLKSRGETGRDIQKSILRYSRLLMKMALRADKMSCTGFVRHWSD